MSPWFALFTFINSWFLALFFVAPFFVRPENRRAPQEYAAAPAPLPWRRFLLANTLASLGITAVVALVIRSGWVHLDTLK